MKIVNVYCYFNFHLKSSEDDRQAQLRERARKLLAEARRGSAPTTEIIRVSPDSIKSFVENEEKCLQRMDEGIFNFEIQNSTG
jgi:hypothetical protein